MKNLFFNSKETTTMKNLLFITLCFFCMNANAQQGMFGKTLTTASEQKAQIMISKLSQQLSISEEQKKALEEITSEYLDNLQEISGDEDYAALSQKITERRDKKVKLILINDTDVLEYQKCIAEILASQKRGYGRR